jgi:hypothetical protein
MGGNSKYSKTGDKLLSSNERTRSSAFPILNKTSNFEKVLEENES